MSADTILSENENRQSMAKLDPDNFDDAVPHKAFAYLRVSSVGQAAEHRDGFKRQQATITKWATPRGVRIVRWFKESMTGVSNPMERPVFQEMLKVLHLNGPLLVVCERYDRIARDSFWIEWAVRNLSASGISLVSASEPELADDSDPHRKAMRGMVAIFAELEKSALVLKLRAARQRIRATQGRCEGRKPYGERPGEQEIIQEIRTLRAAGLGYDSIAEQLNNTGKLARNGRWHAMSISRVLARAGHAPQ